MAIIESSIKIDAPSKTKLWDLVSDLDAEPKYWKHISRGRHAALSSHCTGERMYQVFIMIADKFSKQWTLMRGTGNSAVTNWCQTKEPE